MRHDAASVRERQPAFDVLVGRHPIRKGHLGSDGGADAVRDVYEESLRNFKILVIKLSSLGDVILSSAALRAIRNKFPKVDHGGIIHNSISLLVGEESKEVMLRSPYVDELIVCNPKSKGVIDILRLESGLTVLRSAGIRIWTKNKKPTSKDI